MMTSLFARILPMVSEAVMTTFAEPVLLHRDRRDITGRGIFSAAHQAVDPQTGVAITAVQPMLEVAIEEWPSSEEVDAVTVRGQRYAIVDVQPDGHGYLRLLLHRETP